MAELEAKAMDLLLSLWPRRTASHGNQVANFTNLLVPGTHHHAAGQRHTAPGRPSGPDWFARVRAVRARVPVAIEESLRPFAPFAIVYEHHDRA